MTLVYCHTCATAVPLQPSLHADAILVRRELGGHYRGHLSSTCSTSTPRHGLRHSLSLIAHSLDAFSTAASRRAFSDSAFAFTAARRSVSAISLP